MVRAARRMAIAALLLAVAECDSVRGRRLEVDFRTVEGLRTGDAVYRAGVYVGRTGEPFVRGGRAIVPVFVTDDASLVPGGVIFLLADDRIRPGRRCLKVYALGVGRVAPDPTTVSRGASNEIELIALVGYARAKEILALLDLNDR